MSTTTSLRSVDASAVRRPAYVRASTDSSASTSSDGLSVRTHTSSFGQVMSTYARKHARPFASQLLPEDAGPLPKPWLAVPDPRVRTSWWITVLLMLLGVGLSGFLVFNGVRTLPRVGSVCLVLDENFDSAALDTGVWTREVDMGGFGCAGMGVRRRCAYEHVVQERRVRDDDRQRRELFCQGWEAVHRSNAHVGRHLARGDPRRLHLQHHWLYGREYGAQYHVLLRRVECDGGYSDQPRHERSSAHPEQ